MNAAAISAIAALVMLVLALAGLLVRTTSTFSDLRGAVKELKKEVAAIRNVTSDLQVVPLLHREVEAMGQQVARLVSEWPVFEKRLSWVEWQLDIEKTSPGREPRPLAPAVSKRTVTPTDVRTIRERYGSKPRIPRTDDDDGGENG